MNPLPHAEREGEEPERDHRREVERRDRGHDAHRLADLLDVDASRDPLEVLALQQVGDRGCRLDRLDPATDLASRVVDGLAHVVGHEAGELLLVLDQTPGAGA